METINSIIKLAEYIKQKSYKLVAVDGIDGAGKTTLSAKLSAELGVKHINLDDYLDKKRDRYVDCLRDSEIKGALTDLNGFVIDGVCMLKVLDKINVHEDALIYVKRMHCYGQYGCQWVDRSECEIKEDEDIEGFVLRQKELIQCINQIHQRQLNEKKSNQLIEDETELPDLGLAEEIWRYHAEYKPYKKAKIVFEREITTEPHY